MYRFLSHLSAAMWNDAGDEMRRNQVAYFGEKGRLHGPRASWESDRDMRGMARLESVDQELRRE